MSVETARLVIVAAAIGGSIVWAVTVLMGIRMLGGRHSEAATITEAQIDVAGKVSVGRPPAETSKLLTDRLTTAGRPGYDCRIMEATPERVRFEMTSALPSGRNQTSAGSAVSVVDMRLTSSPNGTDISYTLDLGRTRRKFAAISLCINILGFAAVTVLPYMLYTRIASSENPNVRQQALQVMQMVHPLWPPFLIMGIYRSLERSIARYLETLLANLQYGD